MEAPLGLLKFIAKASLNAVGGGVAGDFVVDVLPGIARDVWGWWSKDKNEAQRRAEVQALAAVPSAEMNKAVKQAVAEVAAGEPPEVQARLLTFVNMVPAAIHLSLRRPRDPKGVTVPPNLPLQKAEDLLPFLPQRLPRFKPGDRPSGIGDWELVKLLGMGGFGEVWRARNPHLPSMSHVALKFCLDSGAREQLLKYEAGVLGRVMQHGAQPGIVRLQHTYLGASPPCLEYEFIEGGDLASAIYAHRAAKGPLTPDTSTKIILYLARSIGQAHKLSPPIVHRDLKPANVLIRQKEGKSEFLITDFGIGGVAASQALEQTRQGNTSQPMLASLRGSHTPLYASPEQKRGDPPDPRDDVHALGIIWYQLLAGDFGAGVPLDWRQELAEVRIEARLLELLAQCIASKADRRPANAAVLAASIDEVLADIRRQEGEKKLAELWLEALVRTGGSPTPEDATKFQVIQKQHRVPDESARPIKAGAVAQWEGEHGPQPAMFEQDMKEALEEWRTKGSTRAYFARQGPTRIGDWQTAAQRGDASAQWLLARCLQEGTGVEKSPQAAVTWLRRAAESGLAVAQNELGDCYTSGEGVEEDWAESFRWYSKAAEQELAEAQKNLGVCYAQGEGVAADLLEAVKWYRRAADQGWAEAQKYLGDCYFEGSGVTQDSAEAVRWFRRSAESDYPSAQVRLGLCYGMGEGVEESPTEAARWYRKAAERGDPTGQDYLGACYFNGYGVEQDYPQALTWYRKAAQQGLASAQANLGDCYVGGTGVKKDLGEAAKWYRKAADQDSDEAQFALGYCYQHGRGVEQGLAQAEQWYRKAADQGHRKAKNALKRLLKDSASESDTELIGGDNAEVGSEGAEARLIAGIKHPAADEEPVPLEEAAAVPPAADGEGLTSEDEAKTSAGQKAGRKERTLKVLHRRGKLTEGTRIEVMPDARPETEPAEGPKVFSARISNVRAQRSVIWEHDGNAYALTNLSCMLDEYGFSWVRPKTFELWRIVGQTQSMWDQAEKLRAEETESMAPHAEPEEGGEPPPGAKVVEPTAENWDSGSQQQSATLQSRTRKPTQGLLEGLSGDLFQGATSESPTEDLARAKDLTVQQRKEIFHSFVSAQDTGAMTVLQSVRHVTKQFEITESELKLIQDEGIEKEWPPLGEKVAED